MGPRLKKILRYLAYALGSIIGLLLIAVLILGGAVFWAYKNPRSAYELAEKHVLPKDLKVTWAKVDVARESLGGLDFRFDITLEDLRVVKKSPELDVPIHHLRVSASVFPMKRSGHVDLIELDAPDEVMFHASPDPAPTPEKNPFEQLHSVLRILTLIHDRAPIETIDAKASKFVFRPETGDPLVMKVGLKKAEHQAAAIDFLMEIPGESKTEISANADLDLDKVKTGETFLDGKIRVASAGVVATQTVTAKSDHNSATITSAGSVIYKKQKMTLTMQPDLMVHLTDSEAHLTLRGFVRGIPGPLVQVNKLHLDLRTPLEAGHKWSTKPSKFVLTAPIELFFVSRPNRALLEKSCGCKLPEVLEAKAQGQVWLETLLSNKREGVKTALDVDLSIETLDNKIFAIDLKGGLKMEVDRGNAKSPADQPPKYLFSPRIDCSATAKSFKSLKVFLDANGVLVPAPLDVMDGTLVFTANGPVTTKKDGSRFPLSLAVDLLSPGQKVRIDATAGVLVNSQLNAAHLDVKVKVSNFVIDLPPLKPLAGLPRVAIDSRIIKEPAKKPRAAKFKFSFNFEIETVTPDAIRLKSPYFGPYLPLDLKIQAGNEEENTGYIALQPFNITYLRRTVHVDNLTVNLNGSDKDLLPIKGRFSVKQTDYTVYIDVEGTVKNPIVTLSSEPYLPKDEIISVLLYDRTSDPETAETTGGVQAALADRAIGLFGLWAFASTPIKSFSYDPVTKVYSATIAVSDDVTARIGTGWEAATHLELRKRISKRWTLTAAWTPATQDENATSSVVLQWEHRF